MSKITTVQVQVTYQIPAEFETEVGRIIVRWAFFEDLIQETIWELLLLDRAFGRLAVREPRMSDRLEMIQQIDEQRGIGLFNNWDKFKLDADNLYKIRNYIAHSAWALLPDGKWYLENTMGAYRPAAHMPKMSRKILPTTFYVDIDVLKSISPGIETLIHAATLYYDLVLSKRPSSP